MSRPQKQPLRPDRVRQLPEQFSWIDRGLVRRGLILGLSTEAIALYFFLITVSDRLGLSFYSDRRIGELLSMDMERLNRARSELLREDLVAYSYPLYQVLALPVAPNVSLANMPPHDGGGPQQLGEVLCQLGRSREPSSPGKGGAADAG